jgi:NAD(P)H-dependent FMN reductase
LKKAHCPGKYDVFFIGYPNWYGVYPNIVQTFIDSLKLAGKTVVFFMTSGSSKEGKAIAYAKGITKDSDKITWLGDERLNDFTQEQVNEWIAKL